jgi:predicted dehydrogenase
MTLRVGIVSAAWGGFAHLPAWQAVPGVEVTAICTSRQETAEAAKARLNLPRAFWNAEEMCADPDIDIVDLGTRPSVRLPMIMAALRNRKHIYNASPYAPDWAGAKAIDAAYQQAGSVCVVDAFSQYIPALRQMKALIDDQYIGQPIGGSCFFNLSLFNAPNKQFPYNWFSDGKAGVSALRNFGSHMLYMLLHLFGPVEEVVADDSQILRKWVFDDGETVIPENTDYANVILKFANGLTLPMQTTWSMVHHSGFSIDVWGEKGRLAATSPTFPTSPDCVLHGGQLGGPLGPVAVEPSFYNCPSVGLDSNAAVPPSYPMALTMAAMVDAIHNRGVASPTFADALEVERLVEAMRVSSLERSWVKVSDIR